MLETFADKVRVVFKNYPLVKSHKFAGKAALTAQAAHLQGKFWVVHDEFFKIHDQLNDDKIQEIVRAAGLNEEQLERDRNSQRVVEHVQRDLDEAYRLAINSVPYNGRSACMRIRWCVGFGCETNAKNGTQNTVIPRALATGHCELRTHSIVSEVVPAIDTVPPGMTMSASPGGRRLRMIAGNSRFEATRSTSTSPSSMKVSL